MDRKDNDFWRCNYCGALNQDSFACCQQCFKPRTPEPEADKKEQKQAPESKRFSAYPVQRLIGWVTDAILIAAIAFLQLLLIDTFAYEDSTVTLFLQVPLLSYYILFEWLLGTTPGKLLTGTRVVRYKEGNKITFWQALLRTITRYLGIIDLGCYFIAGRTLHDIFSSTEVIMKKKKTDTL